ncbi:MAG: aminotransferase class I/II-fold pyridoxal phosphate-dependent enzyme, partial [Roseiflexaceae bacterium]|nr:aminotransferase class I/II-fold pyridoxal phosphate-dependent enzyme [Roseiflexaceae bacterium]
GANRVFARNGRDQRICPQQGRTVCSPAILEAPMQHISDHAPFLESLAQAIAEQPTSFHMPGHKFDPQLLPGFSALFGAGVIAGDLSEAMPSVDYLHGATSALVAAQQLAAAAVGAEHTFFLVNGSTVGNQAMLLAVGHDGGRVLMPRASHRSVYAGLILSGATPIYLQPKPHPQLGFPLAIDCATVAEALQAHPDVVALHITSPSYYGYVSDVPALAELAHAHHIPLLVDEAHGAHFPYHPALPPSAVRCGADVVVQSAHKTLGALTQAALLHHAGNRVDLNRIQSMLALLQSSSPSVLLTASLDAARQQASQRGHELLTNAIALANDARAAIRTIPGLWCYGDELIGQNGIAGHDPTKLVIRVSDSGWNGIAFAERLWARYRLSVEFADPHQLIGTISMADTRANIDVLLGALRAIAAEPLPVQAQYPTIWPTHALPPMILTPRQASLQSSQPIALAESVGMICAEPVIPYPPGIPLIMPGEQISADLVAYLGELLALGVKIVGPQQIGVGSIRVICSPAA